MNFDTCVREGIVIDGVECDGLRLAVARTGAEMVSLSQEGVGFLYRDDDLSVPDSGWGNHATVMGYFLHRLWKEQSVYRGSVIRGGNHGFLRHFDFAEPERLADGLAYHVAAKDIPPDAYPLRVSLRLTYRLIGGSVRVEFSLTNEEPELEAHLSFGVHPGFAVSSLDSARVLLPAGRYVWHMAPENFLNGETAKIDFPGGEMPFAKSDLPGSFLLGLEQVPEPVFRLEDSVRGTAVELDFSEAPYVTLWSDSKAFVCIEPCWGLPDSNPPVPFEEKAGIQVIAPGKSLARGFSIRPYFLPC